MTRSEAREQAFTLIFEHSFKNDSIDDILHWAAETRGLIVDDFALKLLTGVIENIKEIDLKIENYSLSWKKNRIPRVTLAILRLAVFEIDYLKDIPIGATINEAVELSKKFASQEDASFVNGLLGAMTRDREAMKT